MSTFQTHTKKHVLWKINFTYDMRTDNMMWWCGVLSARSLCRTIDYHIAAYYLPRSSHANENRTFDIKPEDRSEWIILDVSWLHDIAATTVSSTDRVQHHIRESSTSMFAHHSFRRCQCSWDRKQKPRTLGSFSTIVNAQLRSCDSIKTHHSMQLKEELNTTYHVLQLKHTIACNWERNNNSTIVNAKLNTTYYALQLKHTYLPPELFIFDFVFIVFSCPLGDRC